MTASRITVAGPAGRVSAVQRTGTTGLPVMFLHPVNTAATIWDAVAERLGRPSVAVDYRGHGRSEPGPRYLPEDYAADALAVLDHVGWPRMHLVGGSIGGAVAVEVALRAQDRVASIACLGSTLHLGMPATELAPLLAEIRGAGIAEWFDRNGSGLTGPASVTGVVEFLVEVSRDRDPEVVAAVTRDTFSLADSRPAARALARPLPPVLVAVGSADATCPPALADELAAALDTEAVHLPEIGHLPMLEAPDAIVALLDKLHSGVAR